MAQTREYLVTVEFRVHRSMAIGCWSSAMEGFFLSHSTPSEAAKPPKPTPFPNLTLNSFHGFILYF